MNATENEVVALRAAPDGGLTAVLSGGEKVWIPPSLLRDAVAIQDIERGLASLSSAAYGSARRLVELDRHKRRGRVA